MKTTKSHGKGGARSPGRPAEGGLESDRQVFERQRAQLLRRYPGEYVALAAGRVVDHDTDDEALAARMFSRLGDAPFYLARVEDTPTVYELPSPELVG
jgi:hypothetical protein